MRLRLIVFAAALWIVGGVNAQDADMTTIETPENSTFRGGDGRLGVYESPALRETPELLWSFDTPRPNRTTPVVAGGIVLFGNEDGTLFAADVNTGAEVWRHPLSGSVVSTATLMDDTIYVGSLNGSIYALDAETGETQWEFATENDVYSSPLVTDDKVIVGSLDGNLYALDRTSGEEIWRYEVGGEIWSSPALEVTEENGERIFIASRDGRVVALDGQGVLDWAFEAGAGMDATPAVDNGMVYIGTYDGIFFALNATDGSEVWRAELGSPIYTSAAVTEDTLYIITYEGTLAALEREMGAELWRAAMGQPAYSSPTAVIDEDGTVVYAVTEFEGLMYAFDGASGTELWRYTTGQQGDWRSSSPVIVDGVLFVGSDRDGVIALSPSTP